MATPSSTSPNLSLWRYKCTGKAYTEHLGDGVTLTLMLIPGGEFTMGAPPEEPESRENERPQHRVSVASFFMGRYAVTQAQWQAVAGYARINQDLDPDPASFKGEYRPVEKVSWDDAQEFCQRLSAQAGKPYRLPSEAEWEYACRAGTTTAFHYGDILTPEVANYGGSFRYDGSSKYDGGSNYGASRGMTADVGSFPANAWGLHDMHGNVWEWCEDDYHDSYAGAPEDGSAWIEADRSTTRRVLRGGSWGNSIELCRSVSRNKFTRNSYGNNVGFRVCCVPPGFSLSTSALSP